MTDVVLIVEDMTRLRAELASHREQLAKSKAKGRKDACKEIARTISETQEAYQALYDQLQPEVAAAAEALMDQLEEAQAGVNAVRARIAGAAPPVAVPVAEASGTAHDATVFVIERGG